MDFKILKQFRLEEKNLHPVILSQAKQKNLNSLLLRISDRRRSFGALTQTLANKVDGLAMAEGIYFQKAFLLASLIWSLLN